MKGAHQLPSCTSVRGCVYAAQSSSGPTRSTTETGQEKHRAFSFKCQLELQLLPHQTTLQSLMYSSQSCTFHSWPWEIAELLILLVPLQPFRYAHTLFWGKGTPEVASCIPLLQAGQPYLRTTRSFPPRNTSVCICGVSNGSFQQALLLLCHQNKGP